MHVSALESWEPTNLASLYFISRQLFFLLSWHGSLKTKTKKKRLTKNHAIAFFLNPCSDMYNCFTSMFLVSVDRKFAGDYYNTS